MRKLFFILLVSMMTLSSSAQLLTWVEDNHYESAAANDVNESSSSTFTCPDNKHPHIIDMGLPSGTKWACCNVGANAPEDCGGYYAWGEIEEKDYYNWETYKYYNNSDGPTRIGRDISSVKKISGVYEATNHYDVAHVKWGEKWYMPSKEKYKELVNYCSFTWTKVNGVNGGLFKGRNGNTIFFPAAGARWENYLFGVGTSGLYWSSIQDPAFIYDAFVLSISDNNADWSAYGNRNYGLTVRPVSK